MKQSAKNEKRFLMLSGALFLALLLPLVYYSKSASFFFVNGHHSPFFDGVFKYWTWLGTGYLYLVVLAVFIFKKDYRGIALVVAIAILQALLSTVFKQVVFPGMWRPAKALEEFTSQIHFVDGVKVHRYHSFPSGHTATAFAIVGLLALRTKKTTIQLVLLILGLGVGYSRIYLAQHFFIDTYFGALTGMLSAMVIYFWFNNKPPGFLKRFFIQDEKTA